MLLQKRRSFLEDRLNIAEINRRAELDKRIHKAHDEEIKVKEIAFIQVIYLNTILLLTDI